MRRAIVIGAGSLALAAAFLAPMPAQSSSPMTPPDLPSFEGDTVIPPAGSPRTKMPRIVHEHGTTTYKAGVYDVQVLVVATDVGPAPWDEAAARRNVEAMDAWSLTETGGLFRFRLAGFQALPPYPGRLCGVGPALEHAAPEVAALTASAGATDVLPVVVSRWPAECPAAGQANLGAPGAWVGVEPRNVGDDLNILIHEVFHNLGLEHSGAVTPATDLAQPWPAGLTPAIAEYGDASDVMGDRQYECTYNGCTIIAAGLHGHHRNILGAVPAEAITHVPMEQTETSTTVSLKPLSDPASGVRLAYLPWLNRSKLLIEYRPPAGRDTRLDADYGARTGVYIRLIDTDLTSGPSPYPVEDDSTYYYGTVALPSGAIPAQYWSIPLGFRTGGVVTLPDGSRVDVLAADSSAASVRVTRPADTQPPSMSPPRIEFAGGQCTRYPCTLPASAIRKGKYRLWVSFGAFDDDQWVASVRATVNGTEALFDERPAPDGTDEETSMSPGSGYWGAWRTYIPGRYTIVYTYTDLAGNAGTSTYQVILPKPKKKR